MRHLRVVSVLLKRADTEFDSIFVKEDIILNDDESIVMFRTVIDRVNVFLLRPKLVSRMKTSVNRCLFAS